MEPYRAELRARSAALTQDLARADADLAKAGLEMTGRAMVEPVSLEQT